MHLQPHRLIEELFETNNPTIYSKIRRRYTLDCSYCRPHKTENANHKPIRPDRYKNKRRLLNKRETVSIRDPKFWQNV